MNDSNVSAAGTPRVTVFIAAYNAEAYIAEAIESVLAQGYEDYELLIVDDASRDATGAICRRYAARDQRVRLETLPENVGRARARQAGLDRARGEYLAILDADDRCLPGRLQRQVGFLDTHPDIDVLGTRWQGIDQAGHPVSANNNVAAMSPDTVTCYLLFRGILHNPTVMARRAALAAHGYDPAFEVAEDYDLWARMIGRHRFALLNERLTAYRIHPDQASTARENESRARRCQIQARELADMGLVFTDTDIRRHNLLYTGNRLFEQVFGRAMNGADARWAGQWLQGLIAANARVARFPEPALTRLSADMLANVCRKARPEAGLSVWLGLFRAGLAGAWLRNRRDTLFQAARRRGG